jgi:hypothetical protein
MFCWVAEELYGKDHPKVRAARKAMLLKGGWFARHYREQGREWASLLKQHPFLKPLVQPVWDDLAIQGGYPLTGKVEGRSENGIL